MQHIVLVVPAESYRADAFLQAAARTGMRLTLLTDASVPIGDVGLHVSSMSPPPEELAFLVNTLFDLAPTLVIGIDETSTRLAATLSDQLGLTIGKAQAVERAVDKLSLREVLGQAELSQPKYMVTTLGSLSLVSKYEIDAIVAGLGESFIVKPPHETASRGVIRVTNTTLAQDLKILKDAIDPTAPLLLESYVEGPEFAVEGILNGEDLEVLMIFAKPDIGEGPYFWESTYLGPAKLAPGQQRELTNAVERGARALGLADTPVHAELRLTNGRATILELAPRSIGGRCSAAIQFGDGQRLEDIILQRALGDRSAIRRHNRSVGIYMIPTPRMGTFREVRGIDMALATSGITGVEITVNPGTLVYPPPLTDRYLGFIFAEGLTHTSVSHSLAVASAHLTIVIDPVAEDSDQ
ncbi:ATP-grasp domain-containing protein [Ferrimicrobium sp.]|uniref:ATP-grasp domain-containing protein n=1 Tax=Ferrimicrobium sp. TaxID=2926050 RepID=UPI002616BC56|nr:ATP-grasp domain-containing protein [Ferrimicrobium sp.]